VSALKCPELRLLCKQQKLPSSGNKATLLERLGREELRDASCDDSALKVSPVKVDGRAEACPCCGGVVTPDHECGAASLELQGAELAASGLVEECAVDSPAPPTEFKHYSITFNKAVPPVPDGYKCTYPKCRGYWCRLPYYMKQHMIYDHRERDFQM
jgi:hypothetical protein